jgi:hypothetical protein
VNDAPNRIGGSPPGITLCGKSGVFHTAQDSEFAQLLVDEDYEVMPNTREAQEPELLGIDLSTLTTGWTAFTAHDSIAI